MKLNLRLAFSSLLLLFVQGLSAQGKDQFTFNDTSFLLNGRPFQMISGELHYTRIPREAWRDRIKMAKAMGLNTIGTYVFWNVHEPEKGEYDFSGNNDIAAFVQMAKEEGMWVVLRPSPYVCAEWEFGGYPYWLQKEKEVAVRSRNPLYLKYYENYLKQVGKQLAPLLVNHGGNILLVQVENEYGSYGNDKAYLDINRKMFIAAGFDCTLYTCDPAKDVSRGSLPGLFPAVNGVSDPAIMKEMVRANNGGKGPFYIAEWYPAWFDWWGAPHHKVPAQNYMGKLDTILAAGISINMYMFHGGTTRGFMNGANYYDSSYFQPQISSYDYDAPLDEAGNATEKFMMFRSVIQKHLPRTTVLPDVPAKKRTIAFNDIRLEQSANIFEQLPAPVKAATPLSFEALNQAYGYVLYRASVKSKGKKILKISGLKDYAIVYIDGKKVGVLNRMLKTDSIELSLSGLQQTLDIFVENMGRVNFGKELISNTKGITGQVLLGGKEIEKWDMYRFPFRDTKDFSFTANEATSQGPVLRKGSFVLNETGDTYVDMSHWGKGCVWVNGHHLGKYWNIGPQQTVYLPAEWLNKGRNEMVVLDILSQGLPVISTLETPVLDKVMTGSEGNVR